MKPLAALMTCLLTGCGVAKSGCLTSCGVFDPTPSQACTELQRVEDSAIWAFQRTKDLRLHHCPQAKGFQIAHVDAGIWLDRYGRRVTGLTHCEQHLITIGSAAYKDGSLVHEYAHMLQGCMPLPPADPTDYYHSNWARDGIVTAIDSAWRYDGGY